MGVLDCLDGGGVEAVGVEALFGARGFEGFGDGGEEDEGADAESIHVSWRCPDC